MFLLITEVFMCMLQTSECVENLNKLMLDLSNLHSDSDTTRFINRLLSDDDNQVGLVINERYVNIPPPISVPLFQALRYYYFYYLINTNNIIFSLYLLLLSLITKKHSLFQ